MLLEYIKQPWPWYISGPLIALVMYLLLKQGKDFGMSNNLRTMCTVLGAGKTSSFQIRLEDPVMEFIGGTRDSHWRFYCT
jgi:hypothetical protein